MRMSLKNKLLISFNKIYLSLCVFERKKHVEINEKKIALRRELNNIEPNPQWSALRKLCRQLAALFIWPIITPLYAILIEIPLTIIHHAIITLVDLFSDLYTRFTTPAKNDFIAPIAPKASNRTSSNTPVTDAIASLHAKLPNNPITSAYKIFCATSNNSKTQYKPEEDETLDVNPYRSYRGDFV